MEKVYMVRSYFEDFESARWQIIGLYTDKEIANEITKKWEDFYEEKRYSIFNEPKDWSPTTEDLSYGDDGCVWEDSTEYSDRCAKYGDIIDFKYIEVEEFDLNRDMSLNNTFIDDDLLRLMTQWDRNYKIEKIIK